MDATERLVEDHLKYREFTDVVYEPDGNVPPDFLVNGTIAIEVRRLNQNYSDGVITKGLEEVAIPLRDKVKALLASVGPPIAGESWFIHFRFTRPVEQWKTLEPKLRVGLEAFARTDMKTRTVVATGQGFELEVFCRASKLYSSMFVLGGYSDQQSGGWLLAEMGRSINLCASEKSRKIQKVRSKYAQWWLALVDQIGYSLDDFDRETFRDQVSIHHDWDKIILIDPGNPLRWFEI